MYGRKEMRGKLDRAKHKDSNRDSLGNRQARRRGVAVLEKRL